MFLFNLQVHFYSAVSYEDCQNKLKVDNCTGTSNPVCYQADIKFKKDSKIKGA